MINISLQPEYVFDFFGFQVTNTLMTSLAVSFLLVLFSLAFYIFRHRDENKNPFLKMWHVFVYEMLGLADAITGDRQLSKRLLPLISTLFLFIISANLIALLPGFLGSFFIESNGEVMSLFRSPNSDLTTTLALSIVTVVAIQYFSISILGGKVYLKKFFNFSGPIDFILGLFEVLSEVMRVLSFSFRLFGNVFAGEVLLLVIAFMVPYVLPIPFMVLEVFIGFIQAYIFCILALTYIRLSTQKTLERG